MLVKKKNWYFVALYFTLISLLLDEGIDITCLNILTEDMMKELIPKIGHRAKLKANIDEWRKVLDLTNDNQITIMVSTDSYIANISIN